MFDEKADGYEELTHDGKLRLYTRNGIFQARAYIGGRRYLTKSLKTRKLDDARAKAEYFWYEIQIKQDNDLPVRGKKLKDVIAEYLKLRKTQNQRGLKKSPDRRSQEYTSDQNLRQMERVSKFWLEYCGSRSVETIDNAVLTDFVAWRRDGEPSLGAVAICASRLMNAAEQLRTLPRYQPLAEQLETMSVKCRALVDADSVEFDLAA